MKEFTEKPRQGRGGRKPALYLVLDCETATLPFADEIALDAKQKLKIAIAKPLIYDLGWRIIDRTGFVYSEHSYIITEIFAVPSVFNTAYYREKRPIYLDRLDCGETVLKPWKEVRDIFMEDMQRADYVVAYNAMFDYKKAIPFTELYINKLYSRTYQEWEADQYRRCVSIVKEKAPKTTEREFDPEYFIFRGIARPIIDLWGVACRLLINTVAYKELCVSGGMISPSGEFFKSSAESTYRYIMEMLDFNEAHTAIDDARIESEILRRALHKAKVPEGIIYFPFKELGTTHEFLLGHKRGHKKEYAEVVINKMREKWDEMIMEGKAESRYASGFLNRMLALCEEFGIQAVIDR